MKAGRQLAVSPSETRTLYIREYKYTVHTLTGKFYTCTHAHSNNYSTNVAEVQGIISGINRSGAHQTVISVTLTIVKSSVSDGLV